MCNVSDPVARVLGFEICSQLSMLFQLSLIDERFPGACNFNNHYLGPLTEGRYQRWPAFLSHGPQGPSTQ